MYYKTIISASYVHMKKLNLKKLCYGLQTNNRCCIVYSDYVCMHKFILVVQKESVALQKSMKFTQWSFKNMPGCFFTRTFLLKRSNNLEPTYNTANIKYSGLVMFLIISETHILSVWETHTTKMKLESNYFCKITLYTLFTITISRSQLKLAWWPNGQSVGDLSSG